MQRTWSTKNTPGAKPPIAPPPPHFSSSLRHIPPHAGERAPHAGVGWGWRGGGARGWCGVAAPAPASHHPVREYAPTLISPPPPPHFSSSLRRPTRAT